MIAGGARLMRLFSQLREFFHRSRRTLRADAPQYDRSKELMFSHVGPALPGNEPRRKGSHTRSENRQVSKLAWFSCKVTPLKPEGDIHKPDQRWNLNQRPHYAHKRFA